VWRAAAPSGSAAAKRLSFRRRSRRYTGRGGGVGRGLGSGLDLGEGVGLGVAVGVEVGVGVAEGVGVGVMSDWKGTATSTVTGDPVLKKPIVAGPDSGGAVESNRKLYNVPQRIALAFGFCTMVSVLQVPEQAG
jgi:hypothetical protein